MNIEEALKEENIKELMGYLNNNSQYWKETQVRTILEHIKRLETIFVEKSGHTPYCSKASGPVEECHICKNSYEQVVKERDALLDIIEEDFYALEEGESCPKCGQEWTGTL